MRKGWVVPPLRRLSSIAYAVQPPSSSRTVTKSTANRPMHPERREVPTDDHRRLGDERGVRRVGGEDAAEVGLPARAAEQLVVGREQLDRPVRRGPHLDARAGQGRPGDPLLDDAATLLEGGQVGVHGRSRSSPAPSPAPVRAPRQPRRGRRMRAGRAGRRGRCRIRRRPRSSSRSPPSAWAAAAASPRARRRGRRPWRRSSAPTGHRTPSCSNIRRQPVLLPRSASRGSAPYIGMPRLSATSRSSDGRVVGDEVAACRVGDQLADAAQHPRARRAAWRSATPGRRRRPTTIVRRGGRGAGSRRAAGRGSTPRSSRATGQRRHVDHPQPRLSEQEQEEQRPLLHRLA